MSETRVNMRKIVGLTDDLANLAPQGHRPRIGMGLGVAYAAGYHAGNDGGLGSADGSGELGERDADADSQDSGPTPREEDEGMHDASEALPPSGEVPGLGGLYDCDSGRCVNVRFDGVVPVPDGWEDACTPPPKIRSTHHVFARAYIPRPGHGTYDWPLGDRSKVVYFNKNHPATIAAAQADMLAFAPELADYFAANPGIFAGNLAGGGLADGPPEAGMYEKTWAYSVGFGNWSEVDIEIYWPATSCSEVAYDAASGQFKDGTCGKDPLIPQHLQGQYSGFELCDKDGNKVRVRRTRYGIEVEQEAHGRVTTLDPDTFKVVNQLIR